MGNYLLNILGLCYLGCILLFRLWFEWCKGLVDGAKWVEWWKGLGVGGVLLFLFCECCLFMLVVFEYCFYCDDE